MAAPARAGSEKETAAATNEAELDGMTKAQLLAFAEENDIEGVNASMTKARIIEAIRNA